MNEEKINDLFIILEKYLIGLDGYVFTRSDRKYILGFFDTMKLQFYAYENMRKLAIEYIKYNATSNYFDSEKNMFRREEDLLNILNKVGGSE